MKPVKTKNTSYILLGNRDGIKGLPVSNINYTDGSSGVESCWQLTILERLKLLLTGKVYFVCLSKTHPPILLATDSAFSGKLEGQR